MSLVGTSDDGDRGSVVEFDQTSEWADSFDVFVTEVTANDHVDCLPGYYVELDDFDPTANVD